MLGKEQAVPEHLIGPKELDFTIQPHDVSCCTAGEGWVVLGWLVVAVWEKPSVTNC